MKSDIDNKELKKEVKKKIINKVKPGQTIVVKGRVLKAGEIIKE